MATSTRLPAFTAPSTARPVARVAVAKVPRRNRAYDAARVLGMSTICLLAGTSLHFLNFI
jgi:hypothetical protein